MSGTPWTLYHGQNAPPPETISLRAGPLTMLYENGDLRYLRLGQHEIVRRIYVAVRDHNWGTIPAHITVQEMTIEAEAFVMRYRAEHRQANIDFSWDGVITGHADGSLTFSMDGTVSSTFLSNRIGFCVLHPMSCAGAGCTIQHVDGTLTHTVFPRDIDPYQPFRDIQSMTHDLQPGLRAEIRFSGDTFETEDQRNWTDASYKTYCTPLELPFPVEVTPETRIQQSVALRLMGEPDPAEVMQGDDIQAPVHFVVRSDSIGRLPQIGLGAASHGQPLSSQEIQRLRALNLSHLRVDVHFSRPDWEARLRQVAVEAQALDVALEVALHPTHDPEPELSSLRRQLDELRPRVASWLLFNDDSRSNFSDLVTLARLHLESYAPEAQFAGGTDAFFVQLNRTRPALDGLDRISYSLNPQVHAFDNASLVETLPAQTVTLASVRQFSGDKALMISPVTLKVRFNPAATFAEPDPLPGVLPRQVDPRQMSLFGAGWTLGSLRYLAEGGASSVTYYETTGWLGVMETAAGSALPDQFPSLPGAVFPIYHIFAYIGEMAGADVLPVSSSQPLLVDGIALRRDGTMRLLLANFTAERQAVDLTGIQDEFTLRLLDEHTAHEAMTEPEVFRRRVGQTVTTTAGYFRLEIAPFAVATIDMITTKGD